MKIFQGRQKNQDATSDAGERGDQKEIEQTLSSRLPLGGRFSHAQNGVT